MSEELVRAPSSTSSEGPRRVQLSRAKGWRMPPNTVKVDRTTRWGNPWPIDAEGPGNRIAPDAEGAVGFFRQMLRDDEMRGWTNFPTDLSPLRGKNLACWCRPWEPCHADALLELANADAPAGRETARELKPDPSPNREADR